MPQTSWPAGPATDAEIARRLGWTHVDAWGFGYPPGREDQPPMIVLEYTLDLTAAWTLLRARIRPESCITLRLEYDRSLAVLDGDHGDAPGTTDTAMALAISRAFLAATEGRP